MRAQGEARSAELIGEAVRANKGFLQLRRLEAARDIATLLAASGNRVMLDSATLLLNGALLTNTLTLSPIDAFCSHRTPKGFDKLEKVTCGLMESPCFSCNAVEHPLGFISQNSIHSKCETW